MAGVYLNCQYGSTDTDGLGLHHGNHTSPIQWRVVACLTGLRDFQAYKCAVSHNTPLCAIGCRNLVRFNLFHMMGHLDLGRY